MSSILLKNIKHSYDGLHIVLQELNLEFQDGLTYALLGPSGCGKSTILNILSGLLKPSSGQVYIGDKDVTNLRPRERRIAQVFQFPVVYKSKSVFGNLAFPLICLGYDENVIEMRVKEIAKLIGLENQLNQHASTLTADQKQLVSLGRGLVRKDVEALLMDEPLTVIDPQRKALLRRRIKEVTTNRRTTMIYVTHDQGEALTFADEVLVLNEGRIMQQGTPVELFERPKNSYVGYFIGSPGMNFITLPELGDINGQPEDGFARKISELRMMQGKIKQIGIRPEYVRIGERNRYLLRGNVIENGDFGAYSIVGIDTQIGRVVARSERKRWEVGTIVSVELPEEKIGLYIDGERVADSWPNSRR